MDGPTKRGLELYHATKKLTSLHQIAPGEHLYFPPNENIRIPGLHEELESVKKLVFRLHNDGAKLTATIELFTNGFLVSSQERIRRGNQDPSAALRLDRRYSE